MIFNREAYFNEVRSTLFGGRLTQDQVDGQEALLTVWEENEPSKDLRHFAYELATTKHETASEMLPIEEYGKGSGQPYGVPDPETGQTYYGRGFVQLTWRDNYARATEELELDDDEDLEWHANVALVPEIAAGVMFIGMEEGWFRKDDKGPQTLDRYFNDTTNDPYNAREIINGDKHIVPDWSNGVSIGNLIKGYHEKFLHALQISLVEDEPEPEEQIVTITINAPPGVKVVIEGLE